jgi:hypothetical protein
MNDSFKCKCSKCGIEKEYHTDKEIQEGKFAIQTGLVRAFLDGWNWGKNALCWDCQPKDEEIQIKSNQAFKNEPNFTYEIPPHTD